VAAPLVLAAGADPVAALSVSGWVGQIDIAATGVILGEVVHNLRTEARRLPAMLQHLSG
jgi:DNA-binding IclR family transcriptional regulator